MKAFLNVIGMILALYLCQLSIDDATANKVVVEPETGYRFETNRDILVENDDIRISTASCTKFSIINVSTGEIVESLEETKTPLGARNCSPYYKITDKKLEVGFWEFTGGISEYEITAPNKAKLTLIESEISKKFSRFAFYLAYFGLWMWFAVFTELFFKKRSRP